MNNRDKAIAFLRKYHQLPEDIDLKETTDAMVQQMHLGLKGEKSSLMMIPTYLSTEGEVKLNCPAIAIDAGGTNLRIGLMTFTEDGIKMENLTKQKMLGVKQQLTWQQFIEQLTEMLLPLLEKTDKIGFCFSFPSEILPDKDGKVIGFNKDVKITGAKDMILGQEIKKCLKAHGVNKDVSIVVLNDTVSTLLGGPAITNNRNVDGQIGLILGTGTNTAYSENIKAITKLNLAEEGRMIINMESGGFDGFELGEFEKQVDEKSSTPSEHKFEKCVSGIYLGNVIANTLRQAAAEGLFSAGSHVADLPDFSMVEVDQFLRDPFGNGLLASACADDQDTELLYDFIDLAIDRAARLVTVNLAACIVKMDGGRKACSPVRIMAEGSTFQKCFGYRQRIEYYMYGFVNQKLHHHYFFTEGVDVNMAGSALAALING